MQFFKCSGKCVNILLSELNDSGLNEKICADKIRP